MLERGQPFPRRTGNRGRMNRAVRAPTPPRSAGNFLERVRSLLLSLIFLAAIQPSTANEPSLPEYQVKALFLINFTKYVDWPGSGAGEAPVPFIIGVAGDSEINGYLQKAVAAKTVAGHPIVVRRIERDEELAKCQILFISDSEKKHLSETLNHVKTAPVLTVGETEHFTQRGGVIGFIKVEGRIRLQINLSAARQAGLRISSKLMGVADSVTGKP